MGVFFMDLLGYGFESGCYLGWLCVCSRLDRLCGVGLSGVWCCV